VSEPARSEAARNGVLRQIREAVSGEDQVSIRG
jgi:hypothetical protein